MKIVTAKSIDNRYVKMPISCAECESENNDFLVEIGNLSEWEYIGGHWLCLPCLEKITFAARWHRFRTDNER